MWPKRRGAHTCLRWMELSPQTVRAQALECDRRYKAGNLTILLSWRPLGTGSQTVIEAVLRDHNVRPGAARDFA